MKQDRFLTGILIGIGILIVAAVAVFLARRNQAAYLPEGTPDAAVHNYVLSLLDRDYEKAYGYLADLDDKPTFAEFRQSFAVGRLGTQDVGVQVGVAHITGDSATVDVTTIYGQGDPFGGRSSNPGPAELLLQNGVWKISSMPAYNLWDYSWYQPPPK